MDIEVQRDRYGFAIKKHPLRSQFEFNYIPIRQRRERRWDKLLKQFNGLPSPSRRMKHLVRKGIPPAIRGLAWFRYSGAERRMMENSGLYRHYHTRQADIGKEQDEIDKDLRRTFPENSNFGATMLQKMRNVLIAYAAYNPSVGYCQSLNYVVGFLLLFLEHEEQVFWMIATLISDILPENYYSKDLEGVRVEQEVLWMLLRDKHPKLHAKLLYEVENACGMPLKAITAEWYLKLFIDVVPVETTLRIWDCLFYEGSKVLFRAGLSIFKVLEDAITDADPLDVFMLLKTEPKLVYDCEIMKKMMFNRFRAACSSLPMKGIEESRRLVRIQLSYLPSSIRSEETSDFSGKLYAELPPIPVEDEVPKDKPTLNRESNVRLTIDTSSFDFETQETLDRQVRQKPWTPSIRESSFRLTMSTDISTKMSFASWSKSLIETNPLPVKPLSPVSPLRSPNYKEVPLERHYSVSSTTIRTTSPPPKSPGKLSGKLWVDTRSSSIKPHMPSESLPTSPYTKMDSFYAVASSPDTTAHSPDSPRSKDSHDTKAKRKTEFDFLEFYKKEFSKPLHSFMDTTEKERQQQ